MVFFRELKAADAGTYRCGVKESDYTESFTELQLSVKHDAKYPKRVTEYAPFGEKANISCQLPEKHEVHFCKEDNNHICQNISSSKVTEMSGLSERNEERVVTVSIINVSVRDAGVYWCGAETRDTYLTFISLTTKIQLNLITKVGVSRVTGYGGGGLMIKCEHPQYKTKPKYICKESDGCSERKNPGVQNEWMENGDVSLYDDTRAGVLMVFFRELKAADAGTYRCGVKESDYTERFTELQLSVKHDAKYPNSMTESVYLGEEVNISCQFPEEHKVHFCKEDDNHICQNISSSKVTEMSGSSERNEERVVTVSISNVSVRDAGVYWCGAETRDTYLTFISLTTKIQLNLMMALIVRHEGESAEIICPYDSIYKSKPKSLCKGKCSTRDRNPLSETVREEKETKTDRLILKDNVTASVFTGSITALTAEDAGKYWCAVTLETELNYLHTHLMVIMNEELNLTKYEGDDVSIQCKHQDEDQKSFCKAHEASMCVKDGVSLETIRDDRFSFSDEASAGVFTVNITDLREEDSGIYWCGAHVTTKVILEVNKRASDRIITSCIFVTLLLMGASVLLLYKLGYIKTRDTVILHTQAQID
uniref:Ig-like domain-containing protein n=1 Tax=Cyprinus carpio carpio TaxID=630221 RepID=A0A8C1B5P0_CYPCA